MRSLISHLRYTIRLLTKSPGFTITAVLILAVGIGANVTIFSLVNGVLLKPLPYPKPDRLVQIFQPFRNFTTEPLDYPDFAEYQANQRTFETLAVFLSEDFNLAGHREPERLKGLYVSGPFFSVLGRPFLVGRPLTEADDRPDSPPVAVISEQFWRTHFNSDPKVVGTSISLNSRDFRVVGVTPGQADESRRVDVYMPLNQNPDFELWYKIRRGNHAFSCLGRLKDGITLEDAQADFEVIHQNLINSYHGTNAGTKIRLVPYLDSVVGDYAGTVWLLEGAVCCLLLIACANVGNLLLARAQERRKEVTMRAALGASRTRLVAELLTESVALAMIAGVIGSLIAVWGLETIKHLASAHSARLQEVNVDGSSLVFVVAIVGFVAISSGLFPALASSKVNLVSALKEEGERAGTGGPRKQRNRDILVAGQIALTCLLITGSGLLIRSFLAIESVPLGFKTDHLLIGSLDLTGSQYSTQAECKVFVDRVLDKLRHLPGVTSVALDSDLPFSGARPLSFWVVGRPDPEPWQMPIWQPQIVSREFFKTMGIPLLRGDLFVEQGTHAQEKQVVISERLAQSIFPGEDPIGKQLHDYNSIAQMENAYRIVGIVPNVQHDSPDEPQTPYQGYFLYSQDPFAPSVLSSFNLVVSTVGDPLSVERALRQSVAAVDPNIPVSNVSRFDNVVQRQFASRWVSLWVVSLFGVAALVLAAVGLYGVLSYSISRRKRELAIRIALGAQSSKVLGLIVSQGFRIICTGLIAGLTASLVLGRLLESLLYGISATDPISLLSGGIVLTTAAVSVSLLPALRAARIHPIKALRE
jgi:putative ABC transport system permease protein